MKKALATTALTAALAISLSGCTFSLGAPGTKPAPKPEPSSESQSDASEEGDGAAVETKECFDGEIVTIDTDDVELDFTGACGDVLVFGDNVYANFEQLGNISITGDYASLSVAGPALDITLVGTGNIVFGTAANAITVGGTYNSVSVTSATAVAAGGSGNSVSWLEGPAAGVDTGEGNALTGPVQ